MDLKISNLQKTMQVALIVSDEYFKLRIFDHLKRFLL
ncbi:MAG: hypothetical protein FD155_3264 [Bacteroidetes bacterium]|nr:MAG: hypothetical protein FD155_3264 [Bacteroidota bacterium]